MNNMYLQYICVIENLYDFLSSVEDIPILRLLFSVLILISIWVSILLFVYI